jgi:hypothetical protein
MLERLFSVAGMVVLPCWILLAAAPRWRWSQRLATFVAPLLIAGLYVWLLAAHPTPKGGGFNSLAQVMVLFSSPYAVLAGWVTTWRLICLRERGRRGMRCGWAFRGGRCCLAWC